jgi:hypothetical protein
VLSAEFGQKNLHSTENKSEKNINIKIFLQNLKCCSTTTKDLVISATISEVNFIFNVILMFEVSRLPARRVDSSLNMFTMFGMKHGSMFFIFGSRQDKSISFILAGMIPVITRQFSRY